jgi:hypothetical protein
VIAWPEPWPDNDGDFYRGLGLEQALAMGSQSTYRVELWTPPSADGPTRGYSLVAVAAQYSWRHLWARTLAIAMQFARDQAPLIHAGALTEIASLFRDQREDCDAVSRCYRNRHERERAFDRALAARRVA